MQLTQPATPPDKDRPYDPSLDGWNIHHRRHTRSLDGQLADQDALAGDYDLGAMIPD